MRIGVVVSFQKLGIILLVKWFKNWCYQKMSITENVLLNWYSSMKKKIEKDSDNLWHRKLTLNVRILQFLKTFTQLIARLKNFLRGWLLVLDLKEGLVECATVFVKSEVILLCLAYASMGSSVYARSNVFTASRLHSTMGWNQFWIAVWIEFLFCFFKIKTKSEFLFYDKISEYKFFLNNYENLDA